MNDIEEAVRSMKTDEDLAVVLAVGLREARRAGDRERERLLAVTLAQTAHVLAQAADPGQELPAALTHSNGVPDPVMVARLVLGPEKRV